MIDREKRDKVMKGMDIFLGDKCSMFTCDCYALDCPYAGNDCMIEMIRDAYEVLKAQEPRVLTLEDVKMLDSDYYYLESMRSPGKELREIVGAHGLTCVTWPSITWTRQTMGDSGYGKTWRCWTSRPTDEQRKAVKWDA